MPSPGGEDRIPSSIPSADPLEVTYDQFEKTDLLGTGGNAQVSLATVTVDGVERAVALKEPRIQETLQTNVVERFNEEAQTWSKLDDHDHVVGLLDWDTRPLPWLALEYMDAGSLAGDVGDMPLKQALWTGSCVARALRYAHRHGVAHLDIKPANVLFRETGPGTWPVPKVSDWGLAKLLLDHSTSIEGLSPQYAAPEQFDADTYGAPDDFTDVYQFGAVMYELLTGRPPFPGRATEVMRAVLEEDPDPPSAVAADVPPELDGLVLTALAKDKSSRHDSILDVRRELDRLFETLSGDATGSVRGTPRPDDAPGADERGGPRRGRVPGQAVDEPRRGPGQRRRERRRDPDPAQRRHEGRDERDEPTAASAAATASGTGTGTGTGTDRQRRTGPDRADASTGTVTGTDAATEGGSTRRTALKLGLGLGAVAGVGGLGLTLLGGGGENASRNQLDGGSGDTGGGGGAGGSGADGAGGTSPTDTTTTAGPPVPMGGELTAAVVGLDTQPSGSRLVQDAFWLVLEPLFQTDFDGGLQPALAASMEWTGSTEVRLTLEDGVRFHDGTDFTATDAAASLNWYGDEQSVSWFDRATAVDETTVDVTLTERFGPLAYELTPVPMFPEGANQDESKRTVGTGPYRVARRSDSRMTLARNEEYWFGGTDEVPSVAPIEQLTIRGIGREEQVAALRSGDVDLCTEVPRDEIDSIEDADGLSVASQLDGVFFLVFPTAAKPFTSAAVRRGVTRLFPRQDLLSNALDGRGEPAYTPIPPFSPFASAEDIDAARSLLGHDRSRGLELIRSGFSETGTSSPANVTILAVSSTHQPQVAKTFKSVVGGTDFFEVSVEQIDFGTLIERVGSESFAGDNAVGLVSYYFTFTAGSLYSTLHNMYHSEGFLETGYDGVDDRLDEARRTVDGAARKDLYSDLVSTVSRDVPLGPLLFREQRDGVNTDVVRNYRPSRGRELAGLYAPYAEQATSVRRQ